MQADTAELHYAGQRLHIGQIDVQRIPLQQVLAGQILQLGAGGLHLAGQAHHGVGVLLEGHVDPGLQHGILQLQRQAGRPVRQIGLEVQVVHRQRGGGLAVLRKRGALRLAGKAAAIEVERQLRLHLDLALGRQAAHERQLQLQVLEQVVGASHLVLQGQAAVADLDVVQRKARQVAAAVFLLVSAQLVQNVLDIQFAGLQLGQADVGGVELDGIHHRAPAQ